jgi:hypothetical protein
MTFFTNNSSVQVFKLTEWLKMAAGQNTNYEVVLPMIQRGFVWKPTQIIDLWDSLLQGMPIGTLMVSENMEQKAVLPLRAGDQSGAGQPLDREALGLVDGQQRTLAMLMGWLPFEQGSSRLWVDFGDEPPSGYLLRLRVTTRNHPFGFRRDNPNTRLSMNDRRCAKNAYGSKDLTEYRPHPAGARYSLALDLAELMNDWPNKGTDARDAWKANVCRRIEAVETLDCRGDGARLKVCWPEVSQDVREKIYARVGNLAEGIERLFKAEIPLLRVDPAFFSVVRTDDMEPPLARLFKRIGSNATPLSDADYVYSVLKHMMPQVHKMVEHLHGQRHVASLMTATDLVMSALRLAATEWEGENDRDNPSKEDFHRMIWPKNVDTTKRQESLAQLLSESGEQTLSQYFKIVQENLEYGQGWKYGLPKHMFPYLGRPLVQVLLRLAQIGYIKHPADDESRFEVLRLVLWWTQWVTDKPKASRIAFQVVRESNELVGLGQKIAEAIISDGAGMRMRSPAEIREIGLASTPEQDNHLHGQSRFHTAPDDSENNRQVREFYRHWWRSWDYHHPMLLWLQRDYVHTLPGDPMAGMDDETQYDFDHILPHAQWGAWTGVGEGSRLLDFLLSGDTDAHKVLGNGIGNVRAWYFAHNRQDGDTSPKVKMGPQEHEQTEWMRNSAICERQLTLWQTCSPVDENNKRHWTFDRALAFQQAVERRTFDLYQRLYKDSDFERWLPSTSVAVR